MPIVRNKKDKVHLGFRCLIQRDDVVINYEQIAQQLVIIASLEKRQKPFLSDTKRHITTYGFHSNLLITLLSVGDYLKHVSFIELAFDYFGVIVKLTDISLPRNEKRDVLIVLNVVHVVRLVDNFG